MTIALPRLDRSRIEERGITLADFLVPVSVAERLGTRARHVVLIVAGALFVVLCARVVIPVSPVPFTGQTFGVLLVGGALGFRRGLAALLLYLAIGAIGLPVYAQDKSGIETIVGATGGYLTGFVVAAALVGRLAELGWDRRIVGALGAMAIGNVVIYLIAVPWLMAVAHYDLPTGIAKGVTPFLLGDGLKLILAAAAFPLAWWVVGRRPGEG